MFKFGIPVYDPIGQVAGWKREHIKIFYQLFRICAHNFKIIIQKTYSLKCNEWNLVPDSVQKVSS
ncbi:MAG: hypothetical protein CVU43_19055 [Chloroflexi bacterium HGW-Chloroflexi-5]|nr:MAG: hypothetical protein CVU43_19055 [Chloroflexi bacterium HGW-Chloroflexi-5]